MKVLHVIPSISLTQGGPSHAVAMMERTLSAVEVEVTTLTTDDDGPSRRLDVHSMPVRVNGAVRKYARKYSDFYKVAPGLLCWLALNVRKFDVVHVHALFSFSSLVAAFVARVMGVPYIVRPLGTLSEYGINNRRPWLKHVSFKVIESRILKNAAAVHFTSHSEWEEASKLGLPLKGVVIPLGVEVPPLKSVAEHSFSGQGTAKRVLFLSRLDPKKNLESLLNAFPKILALHPSARLVVAGDGRNEYLLFLKTLAVSVGIADSVTWVGHVDGEKKWELLGNAEVFVLPSFSENFGIAVVEALVAGLPCVVSRGVAVADRIVEAGAGLMTEYDSDSIADAVVTLLDDSELRLCMGTRGKQLAKSRYSAEAMALSLNELYALVSYKRIY